MFAVEAAQGCRGARVFMLVIRLVSVLKVFSNQGCWHPPVSREITGRHQRMTNVPLIQDEFKFSMHSIVRSCLRNKKHSEIGDTANW